MNRQEIVKLYKEKDIECTNLLEDNPLGYHDKGFEELLILKSRLSGFDEARADFLEWLKRVLDYLESVPTLEMESKDIEVDYILEAIEEIREKIKELENA